ncbi:uncharacterized protein HMPREF1541_03760 [Cyphellophora europaea CBS 101466]|uniref:Histone-lysine N-methyltransferase, H3 lysine-79 specific n=1 Tax=Cyphellophora europaea (strain CBS 101466) TaxID=1220924 RepID=W2S190_CYPE1|nr:uncharacterized protein HMPREF1541_03760 [Cyphellophora europaea CBS 101466]ETN41823.1 hypothetical protein HMPREF1541_03760 [Cyphellophora europaea CBS 101466]
MSTSGTVPSLLSLKKKKPPPKMMTKVERIVTKKPIPPPVQAPPRQLKPAAKPANGLGRKEATPRRSHTPASSRPSSKEPVERIKQERSRPNKRASPTVSTPQFTSDDEDEKEEAQPRKRARVEQVIDPNRRIRDSDAFTGTGVDLDRVHACEIANSNLEEHNRSQYVPFFTALMEGEREEPDVYLQYPGAAANPEKYQLVRPVDSSDFRPITEIFETMKVVSEYYLDDASAERVFCEEDGSGLYQKLKRPLIHAERGKVGAQTSFIEIIEEYNRLIVAKRADGTIATTIDSMQNIPLSLINHIIKNQIYSRTVSPSVHLVRQYEGFSDNVYGELLPMFLSKIFKETKLRSDQIFVDLGSGVGNCVLQAALETGCEAWGCEMMDNPAKLADLQAQEFPARCKLWGLKPGPIHLIHADFLQNDQIREVLKQADVILINNQAFTAELNDKLKNYFLDLKEGAQIVSLKYYRDPLHRIKESNQYDPVNVLKVKEMERFSGMVSWTDDPGKWYLQTKDTKELRDFESRTKLNGHRL